MSQTPGLPDGSTLATRVVGIAFTATLPIAFISVRSATNAFQEEMAYRDGDWRGVYAAHSTKVGNVYTVVRDSGWSTDLYVQLEETTPAPTTFWDTLYDVDLRTLPNRTILGDSNTFSAFTMDGQPWYAHTASGELAIVNGTGLVGQVRGDSRNGNPYGGLHFGLRVYAMTGYDAAKEHACEVQYVGDLASMAGSVGASTWSSGEGWGYGPGNNSQLVKLYPNSVEYWTNPGAFGPALTTTFLSKSDGPAENVSNFVLATSAKPMEASNGGKDGNKNYRAGWFARDVSGFTSFEKLIGLGSYNGVGNAEDTQLKMGGYAGYFSGVNKTFTAIRLRVLQRSMP